MHTKFIQINNSLYKFFKENWENKTWFFYFPRNNKMDDIYSNGRSQQMVKFSVHLMVNNSMLHSNSLALNNLPFFLAVMGGSPGNFGILAHLITKELMSHGA